MPSAKGQEPEDLVNRDFTATKPNQVQWARHVVDGLIRHSYQGSQYLSFHYKQRLTETGIEPSVGSKNGSCNNAMAETINGLYRAEVIHRKSSWQRTEQVELETIVWVDWNNNRSRCQSRLSVNAPINSSASKRQTS